MQSAMLELMTKQLQQLDVAIGEIKLLLKGPSSIQVGQTQLTENNSGTEKFRNYYQVLVQNKQIYNNGPHIWDTKPSQLFEDQNNVIIVSILDICSVD